MRHVKRWIRNKLRALLAIDAELTQLRQELAAVKARVPEKEIRRKVHYVD